MKVNQTEPNRKRVWPVKITSLAYPHPELMTERPQYKGTLVRLYTAFFQGLKERKGTRTYIAPIIYRPLSAQMWITQSYLQTHHICLSFV